MKHVIFTISLLIISSHTFAGSVCTHDAFVRAFPTAAAHLGNCPADSLGGQTSSCVHNGQVFNFYCSSSGNWSVPWGDILGSLSDSAVSNKVVDEADSDKFEVAEEEILGATTEDVPCRMSRSINPASGLRRFMIDCGKE
jgi:hypothetical protein